MYLKNKIEKFNSIETPFYYYDMELLRSTLEIVKKESEKHDFDVHYAIKACNDDKVLKTIASYGFGADCVSGGEVLKAIECGFKAGEIAFAGVGKSDREINIAIDAEIFSFNCESLEELEVINSLAAAKGKVARVALRLNPEVDPKTHAYITTGKAENKFGISFGEIDKFLEMLPNLQNLHICGLHFHIGSQILDLSVFKNLCDRVAVFVDWFESKDIKIESLNMGGGLGINYQDPDGDPISKFGEYFQIFADNTPYRHGRSIHFELGRAVVGQCGTLVTRALFNKTAGSGKKFVLVDGSMTELLRPALYGAYHQIENISSTSTQIEEYSVAGGVCESSDVFSKSVELPTTKRGDFIILRSAGAYGSAMSSTYNLRPLPASVYSDEI
ncbi:MAG: diaminopimelate decarboxylase [Rikenellaceae bacterium]